MTINRRFTRETEKAKPSTAGGQKLRGVRGRTGKPIQLTPKFAIPNQYDQYENWVEQTISYRSSPDGAFQSSTGIRRTLRILLIGSDSGSGIAYSSWPNQSAGYYERPSRA